MDFTEDELILESISNGTTKMVINTKDCIIY